MVFIPMGHAWHVNPEGDLHENWDKGIPHLREAFIGCKPMEGK